MALNLSAFGEEKDAGLDFSAFSGVEVKPQPIRFIDLAKGGRETTFSPITQTSTPSQSSSSTIPRFFEQGANVTAVTLDATIKTAKAIFQSVATKEGRATLTDNFVSATPGAVSAIQRSLSGIVNVVDKNAKLLIEKINLPGQLTELATSGRVKAPKYTATSVLETAGERLSELAEENFRVYSDLQKSGIEVRDERRFLEKIQDPQFIAKGIGQNAPNFLLSLGIAAPATILGAPTAVVGGLAFFGSAIQEGGFAYNEAKDFLEKSADPASKILAADKDFLQSIAVPVAVVNGLLDATPIIKLLSRSPLGGAAKKLILREAIKRVVKQSLSESGTESIQEMVSNSVAKTYDENRSLFEGVPEAGFFGGLMGGGVSAATDLPAVTRGLPAGLSIKDVSEEGEQKPLDFGFGKPSPTPPAKAPTASSVVGKAPVKAGEGKSSISAEILQKRPDLNLKRDVTVTTVTGEKAVISEDEALSAYELKGGKVLLKDGREYIVSKSQYENIDRKST